MRVTITEFRRNLFKLVERVIAGETVEFVHQSTTVRLVIPERGVPSKLDRLTPRQTANPKIPKSSRKPPERSCKRKCGLRSRKIGLKYKKGDRD